MTATADSILTALAALPRRDTTSVRNLRKLYSKQLKEAPPSEILNLANHLIDQKEFLPRFIAYELVCHHRPTMAALSPPDVERLGRAVASWYDTDTFGCYVAGPAWREGGVSTTFIESWAESPDLWKRRLAVVCTVALNNKARGGRADTERTLAICNKVVADREPMVEKALSWALRELAKRDPASVAAFVDDHRSRLPARVRREVANKLTTGVKNPKKRPT